MLFKKHDKLDAYPTLNLRRYGSKDRQNSEYSQSKNEACDVSDRVTRVATPTGHKRPESFDDDAIS